MPTLDDLLAQVQQHHDTFTRELAGIDASAGSAAALATLKNTYTSRKSGVVAALMNRLAELPPEVRRDFGRAVNSFKAAVEAAIAERETVLAARRRPAGAVDVTLPGRRPLPGYRHPLSLIRDEVIGIFSRLGYQVLEGPEIEDDYHNFEALNMPLEHPARDMQDTLYLERALDRGGSESAAGRPLNLLRTHTSAMQIRHMERHAPPVRLISIGPVYRRDNLDLTHTPMFHQCEGLVVGPNVTLADLKGTLLSMGRALFGEEQDVRVRPSFFPYTEPSAEVDIRCIRCQGAGCAICKRTGWVEILGSGMVHPSVFEAVGYDANEVTGFAFGMGLERVAILKWDVDDIRLFYENDLRFLAQFGLGPGTGDLR
jgi:phenylalanyl-tRNA synthetase alpha chain